MDGYRRALRSEVPSWVIREAEQAVSEASAALGMQIRINWWHREPGAARRWTGWVDLDDGSRDEINLVANSFRDAGHVRYTCFHESRHAWQSMTSRFLDLQAGERDAEEWATRKTGILQDVPSWKISSFR